MKYRAQAQSQKLQKDLCSFQGKAFNITVIQLYAPTTNAKEYEVEWFFDDQDFLKLTPKKKKKNVLFIIGHWYAKVKRYMV